MWQILKDFPGGTFRQAQTLELGGVTFQFWPFFIPVEQNYNSFVAFFAKLLIRANYTMWQIAILFGTAVTHK